MNNHQDNRPKPENLLARIEEASRPKLRVYIGAAPGVGKTYQMLEDAHQLRKQGYDIVIGLVETFGRVDTEAQVGDLEVISRKQIPYRGVTLAEMDLEAIIKRKPQVCLVDELAHTNIPGSKNKKRYEDVLDLLDAGINVMTAVNIQHLETLNDAVIKSAGIKVRETVPDAFFARADEIINVDISVDELQKRLKQGKVYRPEKVDQALNNFFQVSNLSTLRELALRTVAEQVSVKAAQYREREGLEPASIPEKVMVCMSSSTTAPKMLRTGARIAGRIGARWYAVYIETPKEDTNRIRTEDARQLVNNIALAEQLGATIVKLKSELPADGLINFAKREGITHVIFGQSARSRLERFLKDSVIDRFLDEVKEAAVQVIPTPEQRSGKNKTWQLPKNWWIYLTSIAGEIAVVILFKFFPANNTTIALSLLLVVQVAASLQGLGPSIVAAVVGMICFNFFFLPPVGTLTISDPQNWVALSAFIITAIISSHFSARAKSRAEDAEKRREDVWRLHEFGRIIIATPDLESAIATISRQVVEIFKLEYCCIFTPDKDENLQKVALVTELANIDSLIKEEIILDVFQLGEIKIASNYNDYYPTNNNVTQTAEIAYVPLRMGIKCIGVMVVTSGSLERTLLEAIAGLVALALERARFLQEVSYTETLRQSDKLKSALLASVSHNLRTPLTAIQTCIDSLLQKNVSWDKDTFNELLTIISEETHRLSQVVSNLLEMARIEAGELKVNKTWTVLSELFTNALQRCNIALRDHKIEIDLSEDLPLVKIDSILLEEVLVNLLENAAKYSPKQTKITLAAQLKNNELIISVQDQGCGIAPKEQEKIFNKFYRAQFDEKTSVSGLGMGLAIARGIIEIHQGKIWVESQLSKGSKFFFSLSVEYKDVASLLPQGEQA
ncbi:MAG: two-component system OmpR family sensor histidine kinase KdpD [bacterium]|nr:MAG: two-component system OmpR family sensor histidine kinase KdpD [bacterium]